MRHGIITQEINNLYAHGRQRSKSHNRRPATFPAAVWLPFWTIIQSSGLHAFGKNNQKAHDLKYLRMVLSLALLSSFLNIAVYSIANATVWVYVPDVSQLQYQAAGSMVYFRNFNQFNSSALPCCYNYWIDTSTTEGKNTFALFLSAAAQTKGLYFGVPDGFASGAVTNTGIW